MVDNYEVLGFGEFGCYKKVRNDTGHPVAIDPLLPTKKQLTEGTRAKISTSMKSVWEKRREGKPMEPQVKLCLEVSKDIDGWFRYLAEEIHHHSLKEEFEEMVKRDYWNIVTSRKDNFR